MIGFRANPVRIIALVQATLYLITQFGVDLTDGQETAVVLVANAVLALFLENQVVSQSTLHAAGTTMKEVNAVALADDIAMRPKILPPSVTPSNTPFGS